MDNIKIIGAGSIGNHMAHAARRLGWSVDICDTDPDALARTRESIYPGRYGEWDTAIGLYVPATVPAGGYDLIIIGTPPDTHVKLALAALEERPRALLIEKPLGTPDLDSLNVLAERATEMGIRVFIGYDHIVGAASERLDQLIAERTVGEGRTLDVEFREYWGGIFAAHPWLDGPADTYLGYWRRGGGALGEHSHALNLWQHFARGIGAGRVTRVQAMLDVVTEGPAEYDRLASLHLTTETGFMGRVIQDVVTEPTRKWARFQGVDGALEWSANARPGMDTVTHVRPESQPSIEEFRKTRPDDFIRELHHIDRHVRSGDPSPIDMLHGLETMLAIGAAFRSAREQRTVDIDYAQGFGPQAIA